MWQVFVVESESHYGTKEMGEEKLLLDQNERRSRCTWDTFD